MADKIVRTGAEWREQLSPEQYHITRKKGTERPFSGEYVPCDEDGMYRCVYCINTVALELEPRGDDPDRP